MRQALCMSTALLLGIASAFSQEPSPDQNPSVITSPSTKGRPRKPTPEEDIRAIRQMMEEQALKIEAISQQVAKLAQMVAQNETQPSASAKSGEQTAIPSPPAVPFLTSGTSPALSSSGNPVHVVAKGETLTSIARHSKVTVAELLKLNKIENDRALQIGQTLILPAPKPQENPTPVTNEPK